MWGQFAHILKKNNNYHKGVMCVTSNQWHYGEVKKSLAKITLVWSELKLQFTKFFQLVTILPSTKKTQSCHNIFEFKPTPRTLEDSNKTGSYISYGILSSLFVNRHVCLSFACIKIDQVVFTPVNNWASISLMVMSMSEKVCCHQQSSRCYFW